MATFSNKINFEGNAYEYSITQGKVLKVSQRSDTHVYGSGQTTIYKGTGSGSTRISSHVTVTTEIWLDIGNGKEKAYTTTKEIKVKEGNIVRISEISGGDIVGSKQLLAIVNMASEESFQLSSGLILNKTKDMNYTIPNLIIFLIGTLFYVVPGFAYLYFVKNKVDAATKRLEAKIVRLINNCSEVVNTDLLQQLTNDYNQLQLTK